MSFSQEMWIRWQLCVPVIVSGKLDQEGVFHTRETLLVKAHTKSKAAPGVKALIQCLGQFRSQLASEERKDRKSVV